MIKSLVKSIFKKIGFEIKAKEAGNKYPNILQSSVPNPAFIDPSTTVEFSKCIGKIKLGKRVFLTEVTLMGDITIGDNTSINGPFTEFYSSKNPIVIGKFCSIARGTSIQEYGHDTQNLTTYFIRYRIFGEKFGAEAVSKGPIIIGNDVWIGAHCIILSGVTIGDGAVVAANSVVTNDVPPYSIVAGSPAKVLKYRFSKDIIIKLMEIEWWNWDIEKIKRNKHLFYGSPDFIKLQNII